MKKLISFIVIVSLLSLSCFSREIITGKVNEEGKVSLAKEGIAILNEELRQYNEGIKNNAIGIDAIISVPSGVILLWSGAISAIPTGWVICDGNNGTPNLIDRFVIHADADAAGTNNVGDTGGEHTHALTEAELAAHVHGLGSHTHTVRINPDGGSGATRISTRGDAFAGSDTTEPTGAAIGDTGSKGSGTAHENRPKFYALAYIMKL